MSLQLPLLALMVAALMSDDNALTDALVRLPRQPRSKEFVCGRPTGTVFIGLLGMYLSLICLIVCLLLGSLICAYQLVLGLFANYDYMLLEVENMVLAAVKTVPLNGGSVSSVICSSY